MTSGGRAALQRPGTTRTLLTERADGGEATSVVRRTVLPGGLRVITEEMPWVRSVAVGCWIDTGARDALVDAGVHVDGGFLDDFQLATSVQVNRDGERVITNGPFPESREYLGGWTFIDVPDLDAALMWATRCPGAKYGRVEIRPVMG